MGLEEQCPDKSWSGTSPINCWSKKVFIDLKSGRTTNLVYDWLKILATTILVYFKCIWFIIYLNPLELDLVLLNQLEIGLWSGHGPLKEKVRLVASRTSKVWSKIWEVRNRTSWELVGRGISCGGRNSWIQWKNESYETLLIQ